MSSMEQHNTKSDETQEIPIYGMLSISLFASLALFLRYVSSICSIPHDDLIRTAMLCPSSARGRCKWLRAYLGMHDSLGQFFQCYTASACDAVWITWSERNRRCARSVRSEIKTRVQTVNIFLYPCWQVMRIRNTITCCTSIHVRVSGLVLQFVIPDWRTWVPFISHFCTLVAYSDLRCFSLSRRQVMSPKEVLHPICVRSGRSNTWWNLTSYEMPMTCRTAN